MPLGIIAVFLSVISSAAFADVTGSLSAGFDFSSGKYGGTTSTDILYIPVTGKIQTGDLFLKLTVPYLRVTSAGGVVPGMGKIKNITGTRTTTEAGLGDVIASAGYIFFDNDEWMFDLAGNIKFGTADPNKNLGTGENDYSAQLDGFYQMDATTLFATAGYKTIGAPAGVQVNNIAYGTLGLSQKIGEKSSAGLMLDAAQSTTPLNPGTRELTFFFANKITQSSKIQANLMKGFSDSSPDYGFGLYVTGWF